MVDRRTRRSKQRTRRLNKKYRKSQKIGKKSKRIKKKRSRRVKKIIHKGGMFSGQYEGLPGEKEPVSTGVLFGGPRDPAGTTYNTPKRADVKADITQGDKSELDELSRKSMESRTTFSGDSVTISTVQGWVESALGSDEVASLKSNIDAQIAEKVTPTTETKTIGS